MTYAAVCMFAWLALACAIDVGLHFDDGPGRLVGSLVLGLLCAALAGLVASTQTPK